ncbi:hypothetical protein NP493_42g07044 [Ridgeia piscesae]|uniref:GB1/RHD3-type G domain-containing protein n=1 Tax=Ridgeia piscesae TaxID=27915 RepID=A0AAD9UJS2_RIDPI|nr:hypothetical protein NP493_42g07044 [Ridgeia piscesae]
MSGFVWLGVPDSPPPGASDWLGNECAPLEGFPWRGGAERNTTGMLMWSEPFTLEMENGEQVVVLLMDTQGAFDSESTVKDCATVFALSTMLSSVQVFNITSNIQEDDLQHLQLFTEYGRLALEDSGTKPFQVLYFLVRDWCYPYQYAYGTAGGDVLLDKRLQVKEGQHEELQQLRIHVRSCFEQIRCFLMPHPGLKVATSPHFDGRLSDIEPDFKTQLRLLVPLLLSPAHLVVKEINGSKITGRMLVEYFKSYIKIYQGDELPEPKSMLRATAEANNLAAVAGAKHAYVKEMEQIVGGDKPYIGPELFRREHERCKTYVLRLFASTRKMGSSAFCQIYLERLNGEIEELAESLSKHNDSKNIFAAARTPAVLFVIMTICYVVSGVFGVAGIETASNFISLVMCTALAALFMWGYVRYSGNYREIGMQIDSVTDVIWETVGALNPVCMKLVNGPAVGQTHDEIKKMK